MLRLSASLTFLYKERPFLDRFRAAADDGFRGVECVDPYAVPAEAYRAALDEFGLRPVLINFPAGDWAAGDRGIAADPGRGAEFRRSVDQGLRFARAIGCRRMHLMAGIMPAGSDRRAWFDTFIGNVAIAADAAAAEGIDVLLEWINSRIDMPGYLCDRPQSALDALNAAGRANVKLLFDIYHTAAMGEDVASLLERLLPHVGHVQLADCPGRHEPGTGEVDFARLLPLLEMSGYRGWVGCEYAPRGDTSAGLRWAADYLRPKGEGGPGAA